MNENEFDRSEINVSEQVAIRRAKLAELQASGKAMDAGEQTEAALCRLRGGIRTEQDLGEVLEEICLLAEALGLDAETALRAATARRIEKA